MMKKSHKKRGTATSTSSEEAEEEGARQQIPDAISSSLSSIVRTCSGSDMMMVDTVFNAATSSHQHQHPHSQSLEVQKSSSVLTIQHNKPGNSSMELSSTRRNNTTITANSSRSKMNNSGGSSSSSSSKNLKELPFKRNRKRSSTTELKRRPSISSSFGNISSHRTTTATTAATTTMTTINSPWTNSIITGSTNRMSRTPASSFSSKYSLSSSSTITTSTTAPAGSSSLSISSASTSSLLSSSSMTVKDNNNNNSSKKKMLRRSISWDVRPPKVIDHHDSRLHHRHDRTQLNRGGSSRHLSTDPSFKKNDMMMMVTKENISDGGGDHSSSNSQNDHASMDCEDDGDDDNDNCGGNQDEESSSRQNKAWYTREDYKSFLKEQFVTVHIMQELRKAGADETHTSLDPETYCERGLENYESKELRNGIDATRRLQKLLVMNEQTRQSILGMKDDEQIRLMATGLSERSNIKAQLRAALDQYEVETTVTSGTSPLEALLKEQKKKMMKEVIEELHKEQQEDLGMRQNQHLQHAFQSTRHHHLLGPHSNSQGMVPIVDFGGQSREEQAPMAFSHVTNTNSSLPPASTDSQDTSNLNNRLWNMTMEDCQQSRFNTLISQQNHCNFSTDYTVAGEAPAVSAPLPFVAIQQQGRQQNQVQGEMSGSRFGFSPNHHATGVMSGSTVSKFSHRAGSAA